MYARRRRWAVAGDIAMRHEVMADSFLLLPWQETAVSNWMSRVRLGQNGHAYLLTHESPAEAHLFAERLSALMVCAELAATEPCGECRGCRLRKQSAHGDLLIVEKEEGKTAISIDQIRLAARFLQQTALFGSHKILLIKDAEAMTQAAANSLLKTLEEPPGNSVLFLTSSMPWRLPATVRSRCQRFRTAVAPTEASSLFLLSNGIAEADASAALAYLPGRPVDALAACTSGALESAMAIDASCFALWQSREGPYLPPSVWLNEEPADVVTRLLGTVESNLGSMDTLTLRRSGRDWLLLHKCLGEVLSRLLGSANPSKDVLLGQVALLCGQCGQPGFTGTAHGFLSVLGRPGFSG